MNHPVFEKIEITRLSNRVKIEIKVKMDYWEFIARTSYAAFKHIVIENKPLTLKPVGRILKELTNNMVTTDWDWTITISKQDFVQSLEENLKFINYKYLQDWPYERFIKNIVSNGLRKKVRGEVTGEEILVNGTHLQWTHFPYWLQMADQMPELSLYDMTISLVDNLYAIYLYKFKERLIKELRKHFARGKVISHIFPTEILRENAEWIRKNLERREKPIKVNFDLIDVITRAGLNIEEFEGKLFLWSL